MLLDHKMIAGCGNIYACEALFRAGVLPERKVKDVSNQERQMLFYYVQEVLNEGINNGGTSISDYRHVDGKTGEMQLHLNVYKQKTCKICGHDIEQKSLHREIVILSTLSEIKVSEYLCQKLLD